MPRPRTFRKRGSYVIRRNTSSLPKRKSNPRNLKKTTARGAYKRRAKRNFRVRREPFVETKVNSTEALTIETQIDPEASENGLWDSMTLPTTLHNTDAQTLLPIAPYVFNTQGMDDNNMIGRSIFSKYLKCKVEFTLPSQDRIIRHPAEVFLVHGWITQPVGATPNTVPSDKNVSYADFQNHCNNQIKQYFNDKNDKLRFISKTQSNIKILGYRKLRVKKSNNLGLVPTAYESLQGGLEEDIVVGSSPKINMTCSWPCMKKIHLTKGHQFQTTHPPGHATDFYYPNHSWLPFMMVYNPSFADFTNPLIYAPGNEPVITVRYNTQHYFSDS